MIRRLSMSRLALALALVASSALVPSSARAAAVVRAAEGTTDSYWIAITLPSKSAAAGMLILEQSGGSLSGTLVLEGSNPVALDKIVRNGNEVTGEIETSRGRAKLTVRLAGRNGQGALQLIAR